MMTDLWAEDIGKQRINVPVQILREQAKFLGQKTGNLVTAQVNTGDGKNSEFLYHFYIVATTLNNYHYRLFSISHTIENYPVIFHLDEELGEELGIEPNKPSNVIERSNENFLNNVAVFSGRKINRPYIIQAESEDEFLSSLSSLLSSQQAQQVVNSLLSQIEIALVPEL